MHTTMYSMLNVTSKKTNKPYNSKTSSSLFSIVIHYGNPGWHIYSVIYW